MVTFLLFPADNLLNIIKIFTQDNGNIPNPALRKWRPLFPRRSRQFCSAKWYFLSLFRPRLPLNPVGVKVYSGPIRFANWENDKNKDGKGQAGGYPDLNREHTMPHTVVLPIELYPPLINAKPGVRRN